MIPFKIKKCGRNNKVCCVGYMMKILDEPGKNEYFQGGIAVRFVQT